MKSSVWFLYQAEIDKYYKIFDHFDQTKSGLVNNAAMKNLLLQTQLSPDICDSVWKMVNPKNQEGFNKKMFCIALHLLYKKKVGQEIPQSIP